MFNWVVAWICINLRNNSSQLIVVFVRAKWLMSTNTNAAQWVFIIHDKDECTLIYELVGSIYCLRISLTIQQQGSEQPSGLLEGRTRRTIVLTLSPKSTGMTLTMSEPHFTIWILQDRKKQLTHNLLKWFVKTKTQSCEMCLISQFVDFAITQSGHYTIIQIIPNTLRNTCITYSSEKDDQWCGNPADMISCLIYFQQPPLLTHPHTHAIGNHRAQGTNGGIWH